MDSLSQWLPLLPRLLIGVYFAFFGLWNIYHWTPILEVMIKDKIPCPWLVLQIGILYQIVAGSMIMFGVYVHLAALVLIPYAVISACMFHPFWNRRGEMFRLNFALFAVNLTVMLGALLLLVVSGQ